MSHLLLYYYIIIYITKSVTLKNIPGDIRDKNTNFLGVKYNFRPPLYDMVYILGNIIAHDNANKMLFSVFEHTQLSMLIFSYMLEEYLRYLKMNTITCL
jgi:hypothetical protein